MYKSQENKYTLIWLNGIIEVIQGEDFDVAFKNAGYKKSQMQKCYAIFNGDKYNEIMESNNNEFRSE
jgi:hypothetical protein